jgi:hypothetical protein
MTLLTDMNSPLLVRTITQRLRKRKTADGALKRAERQFGDWRSREARGVAERNCDVRRMRAGDG